MPLFYKIYILYSLDSLLKVNYELYVAVPFIDNVVQSYTSCMLKIFIFLKSGGDIISNMQLISNFIAGAYSMVMHVSINGKNMATCGTILMPCQTVKYAVEGRKLADEILIYGNNNAGPNTVYIETNIQINRTIKFFGVYGTPVITSNEMPLFSVFSSAMRRELVTFININFEGRAFADGQDDRSLLFLKDASLQIINCSFISVARPVLLQCNEICDYIVTNSIFVSPIIGSHVEGIGYITINVNGTQFLGKQGRSLVGFKYRDVYTGLIAKFLSVRVSYSIFTRFQTAILLYTSAKLSKIRIKFSTFLENNNLEKCNPGMASSSVTVANLWLNPISPRSTTKLLFLVHSCLFRDNFGTEGAGISLRSRYSRFYGVIKNCTFVNNTVWVTGGAISLFHENQQPSKLSILGSYFAKNQVLKFLDTRGCTIVDSRSLGSGGALSFAKLTRSSNYHVRITVKKCTFTSNSAAIVGGSIYAIDSYITLQESSISTHSQNPLSMTEGIAISIRNTGLLYGLKVTVNDRRLKVSVIRIEGKALLSLDTSLFCPVGTIVKDSSVGRSGIYDFLTLYCTVCDVNKFNINGGTLKRLRVDSFDCKKCPPGAKCQYGILKPMDNYWGFIDNKSGDLNFVQLPVGYGCSKSQCTRYNSCAKYRSSTMCSKCVQGYTESMLSSKCIRNKDCNFLAFWAMAVVFVVAYLVFFLFKKTLMTSLMTSLLWCKSKDQIGCRARQCSLTDDRYQLMTSDTDEGSHVHDVSSAAGLVKILFYFYQIEALLDVYGREGELVASIKSSVRYVFNFKLTINSRSPACAMFNMTPIRKVMARGVFIAIILGAFILIYTVCRICKRTKKCKNQLYTRKTKNPFDERVLVALFEVYLLSYSIIALVFISLLNCKQIGNQRVLYLQGSIQCYKSWQYGLMVAAVVWVLPFWLYVCILPKLIREKRLGPKVLFLGCIFPILIIAYCLAMFRSWKKQLESSLQTSNSDDSLLENDAGPETLDGNGQSAEAHNNLLFSVQQLLCAPFKDTVNSSNFLSWDGVYVFRRLFVVSVFVFVENPLYKLYIILAGQIIFLIHHVHVKPYKNKILNLIETGSLAFLVMINAMNLLAVDHYINGVNEEGEQLLLLQIFSWIEAVLHLFVPVILVTTISVLAISRCLHFAFKALKRLCCGLMIAVMRAKWCRQLTVQD